MQFGPQLTAVIEQVAWKYRSDPLKLRAALEHESARELASVLALDEATAQRRMAEIQRILTVQTDWGAGCKLLTDDVQDALLTTIAQW